MRRINTLKKAAALLLALLTCWSAGAFAQDAVARRSTGAGIEAGALPPTADFTFVRVLITIGSVTQVDLDLYGEYYVEGGATFGSFNSAYPVRVSVSGGTVKLVSLSSGEVFSQGETVELKRVTANYMAGYAVLADCGYSSTEGKKYLGEFIFYIENGKLQMVNKVPMPYYLFGIVPYELNVYCQPEALKAQAVAAQSFAMYYMNNTKEWDVKDGFNSSVYQRYRGYSDDRLAAMPYCCAVLGDALSFNGTFVPIFYGHTNGGETALPSHIWGGTSNDAAYAVVIDDVDFESGDSMNLVHVEFGGTGDDSRFRDFILCKINSIYGVSSVRLESIDAMYAFDPVPGTQRNMRKLHVEATVELAPAYSHMRDEEPTEEPVEPTGAPTEEPVEPTATPEPGPVIESFTFECDTSDLKDFQLTDVDGSGDSYSSHHGVFHKNYLIYWTLETEGGCTLVFARYGHGLGLSQIGANLRADPTTYGWDYKQILAFYYPNFDQIRVAMTDPDDMGGSAPSVTATAYGVCTREGAGFYNGASGNITLLGTLHENEHIDILGVTDTGWYHAYWNGMMGYISMDDSRLTMFPAPANGVFLVTLGETLSRTNLRAEPYIRESNIITKLPAGTQFTAWMHLGKWYFITTEDGLQGFISSVMAEFYGSYEYVGVSSLAAPDWLPPGNAQSLKPTPTPEPGARRECG